MRDGRFREDLFYRLNVVRLLDPAAARTPRRDPRLRPPFRRRAPPRNSRRAQLRVAEETMERLLLYRWPGNVRQLQNEMRRMVALAEPDSTLAPDAIIREILGALPISAARRANGRRSPISLQDKLDPTLARIECEMIKAALARARRQASRPSRRRSGFRARACT